MESEGARVHPIRAAFVLDSFLNLSLMNNRHTIYQTEPSTSTQLLAPKALFGIHQQCLAWSNCSIPSGFLKGTGRGLTARKSPLIVAPPFAQSPHQQKRKSKVQMGMCKVRAKGYRVLKALNSKLVVTKLLRSIS